MTLPDRYTRVAIALHWLIAVLIIVNVVLGLSIDELPDQWAGFAVDSHKSIGITVLGLAIMRVLWRLTHRPPPLLPAPQREKTTAHVVHALLYVLMFALPLSGWLHDSAWKDAASHPMSWFGLFPWPRIDFVMQMEPARKELMHDVFGEIHEWFGYVLYALFALHVLGAAKHQWIDRQPELRRMWP